MRPHSTLVRVRHDEVWGVSVGEIGKGVASFALTGIFWIEGQNIDFFRRHPQRQVDHQVGS